jgi:hypothetical protein
VVTESETSWWVGRPSDGTELVRAILAGDRVAIAAQLADEAAFNSPLRRYPHRVQALHLLTLIGTILPGARVQRSWPGPHGAATVISATVDGEGLTGVVEELHEADGRVREVSLLLRPHAAMMLAIKRMAAALERYPLPS